MNAITLDRIDRDPDLFGERHAPGRTGKIIRWQDGGPVFVNYVWGFQPRHDWEAPHHLIRAEDRTFDNRCLIVATELTVSRDKARYRVTIANDDPYFCFAGIWRPETETWPASYAGITVDAYPDLAPYKDRHMAKVPKQHWHAWLRNEISEEVALQPWLERSLNVVRIGRFAGMARAVR
jgi:putative SOS response-associated peptidase YedK